MFTAFISGLPEQSLGWSFGGSAGGFLGSLIAQIANFFGGFIG